MRGDIAEVRTEEGKLYLFVAIDRTSKFAVAQLVEKANRKTAWEFLEHLLEVVPYRIHTILTDNGIQFAEQPRNRNSVTFRKMRFDLICCRYVRTLGTLPVNSLFWDGGSFHDERRTRHSTQT